MGRSFLTVPGTLALALILATPAQADTKSGVDAWTRGDFPAAVKAWEAEAAKGDADSLYNLGQAYRMGKGVPQSLAKAEEMYGRAAALGHMQAADNYGLLLFQRGEQARAMPFISVAAERGDPRAQYLLGIAHFNGTLIAKDWVKAYALVTLAQQAGIGPATNALKQMDGFIPLDQRQQAAQLAPELRTKAEAARARQVAAFDLGSTAGAASAVTPAARPQAAIADSPETAGADFARPATPARPVITGAPRPAVAVAAPIKAEPTRPKPPVVAAVKPPVAPVATPIAAASGPWRIQFGAFGVAANADAMWNRVRTRLELAGHPRINAKAGSVIKLQAGGFASQDAAQAVCSKLKAGGLTCIAVNN